MCADRTLPKWRFQVSMEGVLVKVSCVPGQELVAELLHLLSRSITQSVEVYFEGWLRGAESPTKPKRWRGVPSLTWARIGRAPSTLIPIAPFCPFHSAVISPTCHDFHRRESLIFSSVP